MKRIFLFLMLSLSFISCINASYKSVTSDEAMKMMNDSNNTFPKNRTIGLAI